MPHDHPQDADPPTPNRAECDRTSDEDPTESRPLDARLTALERAVAGDDATDRADRVDTADLTAAGETTARLDALESRLDAVEEAVAEVEAATQALRGYVGSIRSVNERVEARADRALALASEATAAPGDDSQTESRTSSRSRIDPAVLADTRDDPPVGAADGDDAGSDGGTDGNGGPTAGVVDTPTESGSEADRPSVVDRLQDVL